MGLVQLPESRGMRALCWTYVAAWTALLLVPLPRKMPSLSDQVPRGLEFLRDHADKVVHSTGYCLLGLLVLWSYGGRFHTHRARWLTLLGTAHGLLTEFGQWFTPRREADVRDWIADSIGLIIAYAIVARLRRKRSFGQGIESSDA